jgi:anti-sigma factor RsiW
MLFGHLSAEDFTNLLEGAVLPERRSAHLRTCPRCAKRFASIQEVRNHIETLRNGSDDFIPEPDWSTFRSNVRDALLSRSVKRESAARNWLGGFGFRPAMVWGVSMLLVFGLTLGGVLLHQRQSVPEETQGATVDDSSTEEVDVASLEGMSQKDVFDELLQLDMDEADSLNLILADLTPTGVSQQ